MRIKLIQEESTGDFLAVKARAVGENYQVEIKITRTELSLLKQRYPMTEDEILFAMRFLAIAQVRHRVKHEKKGEESNTVNLSQVADVLSIPR